MFLTKKEKISIFATIFIVVIAIVFSIFNFNKAINHYEAKINDESIVETYNQNQKQEYAASLHKKDPTIQQIAYAQLEQATGLSGSTNHFQNWGISTDDKFLKYGILCGDGIPYYSNMKTDNGSQQSLTQFDVNDQKYWQNIKNKNFDQVKNKINQELPQLSSKNEQLQQIKNSIQKAQQDDIMNQNKIQQEHAKTLKPSDLN